MEVRINRKSWYGVPAALLKDEKLSALDMLVFAVIDHYAYKDGKCHLTMMQLADALLVTRITAMKSVSKLEERGYLSTIARTGTRGGTDIFVDYGKIEG